VDACARWWCLTRKRGRGWGDARVRRFQRRCRRSLAVTEARRGEIVGFRWQHKTREGELAEDGFVAWLQGDRDGEKKLDSLAMRGEKVGVVGSFETGC